MRRSKGLTLCSGYVIVARLGWRSVVESNHRSVSAGSRLAVGPVTSPATLHFSRTLAAARGGNNEDATPGCLLRRIRRRAVYPDSHWRRQEDSNPHGCYTLSVFKTGHLPFVYVGV